MKILVTGSAGFIGFSLAKNLRQHDDTVVVIDNIHGYHDVSPKYARLAETGVPHDAIKRHTPVQSNRLPLYSFPAPFKEKRFY